MRADDVVLCEGNRRARSDRVLQRYEIEGLENPTAEHIAAWIWERTKAALPALSSVKVYETPMSWAEYEGDAL